MQRWQRKNEKGRKNEAFDLLAQQLEKKQKALPIDRNNIGTIPTGRPQHARVVKGCFQTFRNCRCAR